MNTEVLGVVESKMEETVEKNRSYLSVTGRLVTQTTLKELLRQTDDAARLTPLNFRGNKIVLIEWLLRPSRFQQGLPQTPATHVRGS